MITHETSSYWDDVLELFQNLFQHDIGEDHLENYITAEYEEVGIDKFTSADFDDLLGSLSIESQTDTRLILGVRIKSPPRPLLINEVFLFSHALRGPPTMIS